MSAASAEIFLNGYLPQRHEVVEAFTSSDGTPLKAEWEKFTDIRLESDKVLPFYELPTRELVEGLSFYLNLCSRSLEEKKGH